MNKWIWIVIIAVVVVLIGYFIVNSGDKDSRQDSVNGINQQGTVNNVATQDSYADLEDSSDDFAALEDSLNYLE